MPAITAITVEGYRCFAEPTTLTLAPLTLLYGWNNSGKSSLLRLLPLIVDSVAESASAPLNPLRVFDNEITIRDLFWKGSDIKETTIELKFSEEQEIHRARFTIGFEPSTNRPLIREIALFDSSGKELLHAEHKPTAISSSWQSALVYLVSRRTHRKTKPKEEVLEFHGLVPAESAKDPWSQLRKQLLSLRDSVQWLQSQRGPIGRLVPDRGAPPKLLQSNGRDAEQILKHYPEITKAVSRWYEEHVSRRLTVREAPDRRIQLLLENTKHASWAVDLLDSGQGLQQILPVLVALEMSRQQESNGPRIVAIEEPDANLHDNAQRWLGEHLCKIAAGPNQPAIVLETHSQILMLTIQLAVASGTLPRERVKIYWASTNEDGRGYTEEVTLSQQGEPEGRWPPAFADKLALSRELLRKKLGA